MVDKEVRELFYRMYPDSDPKYWSYFKFVKHMSGGKLVSIDVYYRSDMGTVHIIKGKNDKDPRWRRFLHSYTIQPSQKGGLSPWDIVDHKDGPAARVQFGTTVASTEYTKALVTLAGAYILWYYIIGSKHGRKS